MQAAFLDVCQAASLEEVGGRGLLAIFGGAPKAIDARAVLPNCICVMRRTNSEGRVWPALTLSQLVNHGQTIKKELLENNATKK